MITLAKKMENRENNFKIVYSNIYPLSGITGYTQVNPALWRLRKEKCEFKDSLILARPCLNIKRGWRDISVSKVLEMQT